MKKGDKISQEISIDEGEIERFFGAKNENEKNEKSSFYSKLFLFGSLFLSVLTTIFTFVWGIM